MPKTKRNFVMVFMETIRISVMVSIVLFCFQQGNDTHTVLHIIDNIELKLDFANLKSQIKSQSQYLSKKSQLNIFPKSHSPTMKYIAYLILCKKPHHLTEGFISNHSTDVMKWVWINVVFKFFQMEQHLLHRAVVHWEATQTAFIIANDFFGFIIARLYRLWFFFIINFFFFLHSLSVNKLVFQLFYWNTKNFFGTFSNHARSFHKCVCIFIYMPYKCRTEADISVVLGAKAMNL